MSIYFESVIEASVDLFIPQLSFLIFIIAFYKFSPLADSICEILKIKKQKLFFGLLSLFVLALFVGVLNFFKLLSYEKIIKSNQLLTVQGCIENYQSILGNSREESFEVNGVKFKYNNYGTPRHFFANRKYGDNFIKEKQCINVYYISDNSKNYIVKIEHS